MRQTRLGEEKEVVGMCLVLCASSVRTAHNSSQGAGLSEMETCGGPEPVRNRVVALGAHRFHCKPAVLVVTDATMQLAKQRKDWLDEPVSLPLSHGRDKAVGVAGVRDIVHPGIARGVAGLKLDEVVVVEALPEPAVFMQLTIKVGIDRDVGRSEEEVMDLAEILENTGHRPMSIKRDRSASGNPPPAGRVDGDLLVLGVEERELR